MKGFRRQYLLNPRFQLKYALLFFIVGVLVAVAVGTVAFLAFRDTYQGFLNANFYQPPELVQNLENQLTRLTLIMTALFFVLAVFCLLLGIYITHKVIGPIYRLRKTMDEVATGHVTARLKFRDGDEFKEIADAFNRMLDYLTASSSR